MKKKILIATIILIALVAIYASNDKSPAKDNVSPSLIAWESQQKLFNYNGHTLSYQDTQEQSKDVIVLAHGYPTSSYDWHLIWKDLSKDYRLIAVDMLGFGFSDKPKNIKYTISLQVDIQEALLLKLGVSEFHLVAHDYGDNVAQEFLARMQEDNTKYPLKVKSLVLLNGGLFPETYSPTVIQSLLRSPVGPLVSKLGNGAVFEKSISKVFGQETKPSSQELIDHWYLICFNNGHKINHLLTHAADDRVRNRGRWLKSLMTKDVPILFINGLDDPVSGRETVARYEELVPNPHVIKLDGIGHYPHLEVPEIVIKELRQFIE